VTSSRSLRPKDSRSLPTVPFEEAIQMGFRTKSGQLGNARQWITRIEQETFYTTKAHTIDFLVG
jgi:hypothetical protein